MKEEKGEDSEAKAAALLYKMLKQLLAADKRNFFFFLLDLFCFVLLILYKADSAMNVTQRAEQPKPSQEKKEEKREERKEEKKEEKKEKKEEQQGSSNNQRASSAKVIPIEHIQYKLVNNKKVKLGAGGFAKVFEARLHGLKVNNSNNDY